MRWIALALLLAAACGGPVNRPTKEQSGAGSDYDVAGGGDTDIAHPGDHDTTPAGDTDTTPGPVLNDTWIGGACAGVGDCSSPDFDAAPICETTGFAGGMCTQACTLYCPDTTYGPGTNKTVTRCIATPDGGRCVAGCDFDQSPSGCRDGYSCVLRQRNAQPNSIFAVCLPDPPQRWPGEAAPAFDVGSACAAASDCAHLRCLELPGGYCTKTMCELTGCPSGSSCFSFDTTEVTACLRDCSSSTGCRQAESYLCDPDAQICWPHTTAPTWDSSSGAADCATAWGSGGAGLSACDLTPDDYVVVKKSARNLALCNSGSLVANFNIGLGFAPTGDKEREGDGRTPEGVFYIPRRLPTSDYYQAFLLSYPDAADAARGLGAGLISQAEHDAIVTAEGNCTEPPQSTGLGGFIEIHGMGGGQDWTWGCIAIENAEIDQLWAVVGADDTIIVLP